MTRKDFKIIKEWLEKDRKVEAQIVIIPSQQEAELYLTKEVDGKETECVVIGISLEDDSDKH